MAGFLRQDCLRDSKERNSRRRLASFRPPKRCQKEYLYPNVHSTAQRMFSNTDMRDVEAYGGVFSSANFSGANLTNASFVGAYLDGAAFPGATLTGANFSGASLQRATGLTQSRLNQACGDEATRLPRGLTIPHC